MRFLSALTLILSIIIFSLHAQSSKIAHVNVPELLKEMPETKIADSILLSFTRELNDSLQKLAFQYQDFLVRIPHCVKITDSMKNALNSELTTRQDNLFNFQSSAPAI